MIICENGQRQTLVNDIFCFNSLNKNWYPVLVAVFSQNCYIKFSKTIFTCPSLFCNEYIKKSWTKSVQNSSKKTLQKIIFLEFSITLNYFRGLMLPVFLINAQAKNANDIVINSIARLRLSSALNFSCLRPTYQQEEL